MEKYFHVIKLREKDLRYGVSKLGNEITKGPKITWFLRKANQMKTKRCKRPFKEWEEGQGGGLHFARMNFKTSRVGVYKCFASLSEIERKFFVFVGI